MHASLRLNNASRLPDKLKAVANSAANGSLDDLEKLIHLIPDSPEFQLRLFIPAFYANLSLGELQTPHDADLPDRLARAILALDGLSTLQEHLVSKASLDVWSTAWSWIHFFAECEQHQPGITATCRIPMYTLFLTTMLVLRKDKDTAAKIDATPRVRVFFTRGWAAAVEGGQMPAGLVDDLSRFLIQEFSLADPQRLEEVIEGAGGTVNHLASLMVQHIQYFVPHKDHTMTNTDGFGLLGIFKILEAVGVMESPVSDALVSCGIVKTVTTVICALCTGPATVITPQLIPLNIGVLVASVTKFPEFHWVKEALDSGLLRALVLAASRNMPLLAIPLHYILREVLPPSLAYHSVLSSLPAAFDEVMALSNAQQFITSPFFNEWAQFVRLCGERLAVMDLYDSGLLVARRACDNLECPEIRTDDALSRCASCQNAFYCSKPCQVADWTAGHRKLCASPRNNHHKESAHLSGANRGFLRALLDHDYEAARADILGAQLRFLRAHPGHPCFVKFDYAAGRVKWQVGSVTDTRVEFGARTARSGGRVELHVMVVSEGGARQRGTAFPMRSDSAAVHDRLVALAAGGEAITPAMVEELMDLEVVRTH
ncbi:hypothetical protein B0H17DRAFT_1191167 [Mycena rosella]|uniref:MYND-type domain-containing protein n=1 Tax=Mycena rosella TaxID=1033263 RepID=A0AAD7GZN8_MYCRO|nr:hypothetical protein B0H17DRAFT_1191167 [Mycena rosella]